MKDNKEWKYCVVGNIVKTHTSKDGILRYGTPAYTGGTKVYLCGKYWDWTSDSISVIGLNRFKEFQFNDVPVKLIENVRCQRVYKPSVLALMNNFEFWDCWWHNTAADRKATKEFVARWNVRYRPNALPTGEQTE